MKTLVIYYSYTGNNRRLATDLAHRLNADLSVIVEKKKRRATTIMFDMLFGRVPRIEPLANDPAEYDHVVLVAPIWAAHVAHPMIALVQRERTSLPEYSFITLCGDDRAKQAGIVKRQLTRIVGRAPTALVQLQVSQRVPHTQEDIKHYDAEIDAFCESIQMEPVMPGVLAGQRKPASTVQSPRP